MKKILHINSNKNWRGAEIQLHQIIQQASKNYQHYLFCVKDSILYQKNKNAHTFGYTKRMAVDIIAAFQLKNFTKQHQIDLIHLHDSHAINTYYLARCFGMKTNAIIHKHTHFPIKNKWKYTHESIQQIICLTNTSKQQFASFISEHKISVLAPGIDISKFKIKKDDLKLALNIAENAIIIGIIAALEPEKNVETFLKIGQQLIQQHANYHFIIIGNGSLKTSLQTAYKNEHIHFLGYREDIPSLLKNMDVFLFTSNIEGFGQVIVEAMASKTIVVCNNFDAAKDIIQHEQTGYIFTSIQQAVESIEHIINNTTYKTAIEENAYNYVQQYDVHLMYQKLEAIYSSILNKT
ncbi:MAG: glycosyltransferase family 4 protein [Chitinophagales bacterium]